jgi:carboxyl-terminal processing protease
MLDGGYMRKRNLLFFNCLFLCGFLLMSLGVSFSETARPAIDKAIFEQIPLFTDAIAIIKKYYVRDIGAQELIYGALKGMLSELDPYSEFLPPKKFEDMKSETEGEFGGVGLVVSMRDKQLTVVSPMEGTPAERAGVKAGDVIVKIDDVNVQELSFSDAVEKMRGKPGSKVVLSIMRAEEEKLLTIPVKRAIIEIENVKDALILEEGIGYVRIVDFGKRTRKMLHEAMGELETKGVKALILDLRNNPGGLLESAVEVSNMLVRKGSLIVYTKDRTGEEQLRFVSNGVRYREFDPLVILVNKGSASGSEIVAGAVKDTEQGVIIGEKTFGKASVQTVIPLRDQSALRLTTAEYYTPSGISIHQKGIEPDYVVEYKNERLKELMENIDQPLTERDEYLYKGEKRKELLFSDSHVQRALKIIKEKRQWHVKGE